MKLPLDTAAKLFRESITKPKEDFERAKRRAAEGVVSPVSSMFFLAIIIIGAVASLTIAQADAYELLREAAGYISNLFYSTCGFAAFVFGLGVAANRSYGSRVEASLEGYNLLEEQEATRRTYLRIRRELFKAIDCSSTSEITNYLGYCFHTFPKLIASDEELTSKLISTNYFYLMSSAANNRPTLTRSEPILLVPIDGPEYSAPPAAQPQS